MVELMNHQREAVNWLESKEWRSLIYGDPGVGKSFIALEALRRSGAKTALVLTVASAVTQWREEIERFGLSSCAVTVTNYEKLLSSKPLFPLLWDAVIADESEKIKNPQSKTYKHFLKLQAPIRIALSGSPAPNALHELWSVVSWFSPGILGKNFYSFRAAHCLVNPFIPQQITGYRDKEKLLQTFQQFYFRITDDVLNLPEAKRRIINVSLTEEERVIYKKIHQESMVRLNDGRTLTIPNMLSEIVRLLQWVNDPREFGIEKANSKQLALRGLLLPQVKTIIFSDFASICKRNHALYGGALLVGELSAKRRQEEIERFKHDPVCLWLWGSAAGSLGLNLQIAKRIIHYSLPWTNARLRQRLGRSRRYGQTKEVEEIILLVKDTVEEKIWGIIERKKDLELKMTRRDYKESLEL